MADIQLELSELGKLSRYPEMNHFLEGDDKALDEIRKMKVELVKELPSHGKELKRASDQIEKIITGYGHDITMPEVTSIDLAGDIRANVALMKHSETATSKGSLAKG